MVLYVIFTCQYSGWRHITGNVEDRYLGSGPCRVLISSDSLTELIICIIMYIALLELESNAMEAFKTKFQFKGLPPCKHV